MEDLPKRNVSAFIIEKEGTQIGYIQYYDATKVGGGWWEKEAMGTFGIDLMIGIPDMIGRGVGSKIISEFIEFLKKTEPDLKSVIIDPDPRNKRAIRAFEKAGFILESEILTPGGPALLMRRRVSKP